MKHLYHTQAPWEIDRESARAFGEILIHHPNGDGTRELVARAAHMEDAAIIAAAPEMTDMLRETLQELLGARTLWHLHCRRYYLVDKITNLLARIRQEAEGSK